MADTQSVGTKLDATVAAGADGTVIALLKRLTTDMSTLITGAATTTPVEGEVADGAALTGVKPVLIGGQDATSVQSLLVDTSGRPMVVGAAAAAAAIAGNPVLMGVSDATNARALLGDTSGRPMVVGPVAHAAAIGPNPVQVAASDGISVRELRMSGTGAGTAQNIRMSIWDSSLQANTLTGNTDTNSQTNAGVVAGGFNYLLNGAGTPNWERQRNNTEALIVTRTAQTTSYTGSDRTNYNGRGLTAFLNVTVNPGGAQTVEFILQVKDATGGAGYLTVLTSGAVLAAGGTGLFVLQCYPGAAVTATAAITNLYTQVLAVPRTYRFLVTHSGAGAWTYTLADNVSM